MNQQELSELLQAYKEAHDELAPAMAELNRMAAKIKAHALELGESVTVDGAQVKIRSGYTRVTWDTRALDGFAAHAPKLLQFRSEKDVAPSASIRLSNDIIAV